MAMVCGMSWGELREVVSAFSSLPGGPSAAKAKQTYTKLYETAEEIGEFLDRHFAIQDYPAPSPRRMVRELEACLASTDDPTLRGRIKDYITTWTMRLAEFSQAFAAWERQIKS